MWLFREGSGEPGSRGGSPKTDRAVFAETKSAPMLVCRQCGYAITRPETGMVVDGAHNHTFANPHGIVYEIGCFQEADGCSAVGPATDEFTWFAGFEWRIAVCRQCQVHLGWLFQSKAGSFFFGLILDRLALAEHSEKI